MYKSTMERFIVSDMKTGSSVTTIEAARSVYDEADTDDAGHLVTARDNTYVLIMILL